MDQYLGSPFKLRAAEAAVGSLVWKSSARVLRKRIAPSLSELATLAKQTYIDPGEMLAHASWSSSLFRPDVLTALEAEYQPLQTELEHRYQERTLTFPKRFAVEAGTSFLLYALVRIAQPSVVIEMGVANGHSSFYILRGLQANGKGTLHSIDVASEVGSLLSERERSNWDLRIVNRKHTARSLAAHMSTLPRADLCFHDAKHGYLAQYSDFSRLWEQLDSRGILISDDVDASFALIDFCESIRGRPDILIDGRKVVGVLQQK